MWGLPPFNFVLSPYKTIELGVKNRSGSANIWGNSEGII
jgi:hypothetical protein